MDDKEFINIKRKNPDDSAVIDVKGYKICRETFTIFAGPCRVESRQQIVRIAKGLKKAGAHVLRGGAFKPCTSPHSDWGRGEIALKELREASKAAGMLSISEAMSIEELDIVSKYSDIIQICMRNGQNYELLRRLGDYP